tara:strand:+ start:1144 stop:1440 length:297 start_codon:yes stop_codon:yes gene_type:complete
MAYFDIKITQLRLYSAWIEGEEGFHRAFKECWIEVTDNGNYGDGFCFSVRGIPKHGQDQSERVMFGFSVATEDIAVFSESINTILRLRKAQKELLPRR